MPFKRKISAIEYRALQLNMRSLYIRDNDGYKLDVEGLPQTDEELKRELDNARAELKSVKAETNEYRALYRDVLGDDESKWKEEYADLLRRADRTLMTQPEFEAEMARLQAEFDAAIEAKRRKYEPEIEKLREQIIGQRAEAFLRDAMKRGGVLATDILLPTLRQHVRVSGDAMSDDNLTVEVVDQSGQPRFNGDGSPVSVSQLLESWRLTSPDLSMAFNDPVAHKLFNAFGVNRNGNGAAH